MLQSADLKIYERQISGWSTLIYVPLSGQHSCIVMILYFSSNSDILAAYFAGMISTFRLAGFLWFCSTICQSVTSILELIPNAFALPLCFWNLLLLFCMNCIVFKCQLNITYMFSCLFRMGRDIVYDCWSCDLLCAASSPDLYRINLEQVFLLSLSVWPVHVFV